MLGTHLEDLRVGRKVHALRLNPKTVGSTYRRFRRPRDRSRSGDSSSATCRVTRRGRGTNRLRLAAAAEELSSTNSARATRHMRLKGARTGRQRCTRRRDPGSVAATIAAMDEEPASRIQPTPGIESATFYTLREGCLSPRFQRADLAEGRRLADATRRSSSLVTTCRRMKLVEPEA